MFGTDFPMWSAEDEFRRIDALELDNEAMEKIMFRNAEKFLERTK
ncbi:MAG: amidohydrolase family protein [Eubacteriales bacterium]